MSFDVGDDFLPDRDEVGVVRDHPNVLVRENPNRDDIQGGNIATEEISPDLTNQTMKDFIEDLIAKNNHKPGAIVAIDVNGSEDENPTLLLPDDHFLTLKTTNQKLVS